VRRFLPWVLLGLLGAGVVVGAAVGALGAPAGSSSATSSAGAQAWVARVIATTAGSRTAHFDYSHVTTSVNPLLHDTLTGSGLVDFTSGDVEVTEVDRQPSITSNTGGNLQPVVERSTGEVIGIGRTTYQAVAQQGTPTPVWIQLAAPRDPAAELGLQAALNASVALDVLGVSQKIVSVKSLGPANVGGVATTRYSVTAAPVCVTPLTGPAYRTREPTTMWVDGAGRLVQVTSVVRDNGRLIAAVLKDVPALAHATADTSTTTNTLHFSGFGQPVHIAAPRRVVSITSSTGSASVKIRCGK
jgi:hypothetical protein